MQKKSTFKIQKSNRGRSKRVHVNNGFWDFVISARTPESGHQLVKRVTVNLKDCRPDGIELGSYEYKLIGWGRLV